METNDHVSYELAKKLKKCGFDEPCDHFYCAFDNETDVRFWSIQPAQSHNGLSTLKDTVVADAPTLAHAQKWLRERAIEIVVTPIFSRGGRDGYDWDVYDDFSGYPAIRGPLPLAETYESALSAGIAAALELIKPAHQ